MELNAREKTLELSLLGGFLPRDLVETTANDVILSRVSDVPAADYRMSIRRLSRDPLEQADPAGPSYGLFQLCPNLCREIASESVKVAQCNAQAP